jgi:hypothetical protein
VSAAKRETLKQFKERVAAVIAEHGDTCEAWELLEHLGLDYPEVETTVTLRYTHVGPRKLTAAEMEGELDRTYGLYGIDILDIK